MAANGISTLATKELSNNGRYPAAFDLLLIEN
jgi:hypothetical protein